MTERTASAFPWPEDQVMGSSVTYPRGATLSRSGQPVRTLHLIMAGVVRLTTSRDNGDVLVALRSRGWLLGAVPAILGVEHTATAVALTECELRTLSSADFHRLRRDNHAVGHWLQVVLAREVAEQLSRSGALAGAAIRVRVEHLIVELFAVAGLERQDGSSRLNFDLSVTDLATLVGSAREPVSRILTALARAGTVLRERGWLVVPHGSPLLALIRSHKEFRNCSAG